MELWEKIFQAYPEIDPATDWRTFGIFLRDDSDGVGAYIEKWEYEKPIPAGLKLGKD